MHAPRTILLSAVLGLATFGASATTAFAAEPVATPQADTELDLSDQQQDPVAKKWKCRWVKRIGVVCETPGGVITL